MKKVAREAGTEGKLVVQAEICKVSGGTLRESRSLSKETDFMPLVSLSVNTMASNLTTQVRSFAQVSAAAMEGDFTTVEASGEMNLLKTQINQMVNRKNIATREAAERAT